MDHDGQLIAVLDGATPIFSPDAELIVTGTTGMVRFVSDVNGTRNPGAQRRVDYD